MFFRVNETVIRIIIITILLKKDFFIKKKILFGLQSCQASFFPNLKQFNVFVNTFC